MPIGRIASILSLCVALILGGLIPQVLAVEPMTETKVTKTVTKVENLVRIADNVVVMFDSSGSMGAPYGDSGMTKLQAAKKLLRQRTESFPDVFPELNVGLYSYTPSSELDKEDRTDVLYKMQPFKKAEFLQAVDQLPDEASGPTLMVNGFRRLEKVLDTLSGRTVVFLFTDGTQTEELSLETPLDLAKRMAEKHDVDFQLISTTDDKTNLRLMEAVASVNESSRVHTFESLLDRPEVFTGSVFVLEESYVVSAQSRNEVVGFKLKDIIFNFDNSDIKMEFTDELNEIGEILKKYPKSYIVLSGHTDNQGTEEYNLGLSHRRVEAVAAYLADKFNIDASRISKFWYGEASPAVSNDTLEGRRQNRRVVGFVSGINN